MKTLRFGVLGLAITAALVAFASVQAGGQADKKDDKGVGALPPHPLDDAFQKGNTERALTNGLLNNKLFQNAVAEALKAKRDREDEFRKNPKLRAGSPAQAARVKFLEVLTREKKPAE